MIGLARSLVVVLLSSAAFAACRASPTSVSVTYRVTFGDQTEDLTGKDVPVSALPTLSVSYTTGTGSAQENGVPREDSLGLVQPWTRTVYVATGTTVTLTATNDDTYGTITCSIRTGGKTVSTNTARGANVTATCTEVLK